MFNETATNLLQLQLPEVKKWLQSFDTIFTDCDGTLWHDDQLISGAAEVINALLSLGKQIYFITNNGTKTREELLSRALKMGFKIDVANIICPSYSIAEYLNVNADKQCKVYVIGSSAIAKELEIFGLQHFGVGPDVLAGIDMNDYLQKQVVALDTNAVAAVVVGFDDHFSYGKMMKASNILGSNQNCLFLATNSDAVHRYPNFSIPGTGALIKAIETAVDREALVLGKPNPVICEQLLKTGKIRAERTLMIGDCYKIDVVFGKNCGFQTLLVGTGIYKISDIEQLKVNLEANRKFIPDFYLPQLSDLMQFLTK